MFFFCQALPKAKCDKLNFHLFGGFCENNANIYLYIYGTREIALECVSMFGVF